MKIVKTVMMIYFVLSLGIKVFALAQDSTGKSRHSNQEQNRDYRENEASGKNKSLESGPSLTIKKPNSHNSHKELGWFTVSSTPF
jgi:hypothetical protein